MVRSAHFITLVCIMTTILGQAEAGFHPSGSEEIDRTRREIAGTPTHPDTVQRRTLLLFLWMATLQHQGADTRPFFDLDKAYYRLDHQLAQAGSEEDRTEVLQRMSALIDRGYGVMEEIQTALVEKGPLFEAFEGDPDQAPAGGDMEAEWPMFQNNIHNTGYTTAPGPRRGREAWRVPVGLGWYNRPVIEDGRVYVPSLGMNAITYCLDLQTGEEIWKATQDHPLFGIYKYPAIASTPLLIDDYVVVREVNSHGGNEGQARHLVYLDKATGKTLFRTYAGHVDYRTQYAPVASNGDRVAYPFGVHDIYGSPAICQNFNRLICAGKKNEEWLWDFNVGDIDALAEPVMTRERVIQGTMEGYLYALHVGGRQHDERIAWKFRADGAVNTQVTVEGPRVYFGSNGGTVYCLDEATGALQWKTAVTPVEPRARKHFSTVTVHGDRLYVGAANGRLYCLDTGSGSIRWTYEAGDWIRSRPVVTPDGVVLASVDGVVHGVGEDGKGTWRRTVSTHPIYADLARADGRILVADSNLYLHGLEYDGTPAWRKSLLDCFERDGERIFTDELSGGTYYQSKPTAYRGRIYFGTPSGFLHAVDATTGEEVWKFEMGAAISVGPACADGKIYAGQQGGERFFYCLDAADGRLVWKQTLPGGWVWGSAAVDEGLVYVPTVSGYAVCLDGATGHIVWMYPTAMSVPAEPAIDGDLVYFGSWSRSLYAFDKKTGEVVWKENGIGLDSGTLIAYEGKIYLPHHRNIFMYFDAKTGELLSDGNTNEEEKGLYSNFNATPAFHDDRAFYSARSGVGLRGVPLSSTVYCVDAETATIHWTFRDGGGLSAPAVANGRVYIASGNSPFLYCLDEVTGKPHWIHKLGHRTEEATLCIYRDLLYVLAADGYLHAIE